MSTLNGLLRPHMFLFFFVLCDAVVRDEPIDPVSRYLSDGDEIKELEKSMEMVRSMQIRDFVKGVVRKTVQEALKEDGVNQQTAAKVRKVRQYLNSLYELVTSYKIPEVNTKARLKLIKSLMGPAESQKVQSIQRPAAKAPGMPTNKAKGKPMELSKANTKTKPKQGGNEKPKKGGNEKPKKGGNEKQKKGGNEKPKRGGNKKPKK